MLFDNILFKKHLEKGESVLYTAHKHWGEFSGPLTKIIFFGFALPWVLYFAGFRTQAFLILAIVWSILAMLRLIYDFIDWYADAWLFTNMSIIIVEWHGLFSNTSKRVGYEDTEGVSFIIKGFWGTVFRFGEVTLGVISGSHIQLKNAAKPKKIELALMKAQSEYLSAKEHQDATGLKNMISQMVQHHMRQGK